MASFLLKGTVRMVGLNGLVISVQGYICYNHARIRMFRCVPCSIFALWFLQHTVLLLRPPALCVILEVCSTAVPPRVG
uniref:Putative secreted protein synganglion overexpressed n=1 Tax=Rhipicephalus microplus TaxID=6941 RepID=A0A6M2DDZ4_RHIMP